MDNNNEKPPNIPESANFKPSRFLEKKQQALLLQAQRLHSIKTSEANETQDRIRSFSATQKKEDNAINATTEKKTNEPNLLEKKIETKQKAKWNFTKMNLENWNYSKKDLIKKDKTANKNPEGAAFSDKIFQPVNFPSKQESNISNASLTITETLQSSLFSNQLVLFQMPQNLPFMKSNKKKMSATFLEPDPENEDEILAYLIREKLDSMGNELNSDYTSILKAEEETKKKEEIQNFQFGKLRIYSDNTAEIVIGEHSFELSNSIDTQFFQEMCGLSISGLKPSLYCLGQVEKKIVCKPKLNSIIDGI